MASESHLAASPGTCQAWASLGDQTVTEALLPVGAGVVAVPRACLGPVILVGHWPCRAPL